jgi:hypothetical protein
MRLMTRHEDDLLVQFVAGDPGAFVLFYRRHLAAILAFFLRRTGDPELTAGLTLGGGPPPTVTWRSATGQVIKTISTR